MTSQTLLYLAILGGVLSLDRTAFLQSMISRPIVAGPLAGLLLGDTRSGLICGMLMEPVWLARLPVGGSVPPDDTVATLAGVTAAVALAPFTAWPTNVLLAVVIGLPFGWLGRWFDIRVRKANGEVFVAYRKGLDEGRIPRLTTIQLGGGVRSFLGGAVATTAAAYFAGEIASLVGVYLGGKSAPQTDAILFALIALAGAGALLTGLGGKNGRIAFAAGLVASVILKSGVGG